MRFLVSSCIALFASITLSACDPGATASSADTSAKVAGLAASAGPDAVTFCTAGAPTCIGKQANAGSCGGGNTCFFEDTAPDGGASCSCSRFPQ